jgi:hypothetical protein
MGSFAVLVSMFLVCSAFLWLAMGPGVLSERLEEKANLLAWR